ncbi:MAG: copper-binding protein [Variovorax sp.]|nr:MAG: copper-binding protein [Variovorax sp.]
MAASALLATVASALAQDSAALPRIEAEVRKVDTASQKITLKHAEIPNIDMGAMTMVFRVRDPALLRQVNPGDRVTVTVDRVEGALTVMSMEAAKP